MDTKTPPTPRQNDSAAAHRIERRHRTVLVLHRGTYQLHVIRAACVVEVSLYLDDTRPSIPFASAFAEPDQVGFDPIVDDEMEMVLGRARFPLSPAELAAVQAFLAEPSVFGPAPASGGAALAPFGSKS